MTNSKLFTLILVMTVVTATAVIGYQSALYVKEQANMSPALLTNKTFANCVGVSLQNQPLVNGLNSDMEVPIFPEAKRLSYADAGNSQYVAKATDYEILGFYQERMSSLCWQTKAISHNQIVFNKNGKSLKISLLTNPISRTVIDYAILPATQVLGEGVMRIAQDETSSTACSGGMIWCPSTSGSGGWCQMPPCPSATPMPAPTPSTGAGSCSGGQTWCSDSSGSGGWCQMPPCPSATPAPAPTPSTGSGSCSGGQIWCSDSSGSGGWCQMPPCPSTTSYPSTSSSCSGGQIWCSSTSGSGGWCQMPPCPSTTSYPSTTSSCSGSYQQPNISYPSCNYGTCPSGCTWGSNGCPTGCYSSPTCSGEFQQPNSSSPICNSTRCPSGCTWGSNGCPNACSVSCPSGQYICNGACISNSTSCYSTGSGSASSCPSGQYWCNGSCIASSAYCSPAGSTYGSGSYPTRVTCESAGGRWCQPNTSPHCHGPSDSAPCESDTTTGNYYSSCSSTQYMCNGVCVPMNTSCSPTAYPTDSNSCSASGKVWCQSSASTAGWCQISPCPTQTTNPTTTGTSCGTGYYWCSQSNSCIYNSQTCGTTTTGPQPATTPVQQQQCGQCQTSQNGRCAKAPVGTMDPLCNGGQCDSYGGCIQLARDKKLVGEGAICGDRFCNIEKGENKENCPNECSNEPKRSQPPTTTQYQNEPSNRPTEGQNRNEGIMNEEQQQQNQDQQFKMMKKGMDQFARGVKDMQKYINKIKSKLARVKVSIPPELENALNRAPELITKFKNAKSAEEVEELMTDMEDIAFVMQDWGPRLGNLERLGEMIKQSDQQVKKMQSALKRAQTSAKRKLELAEPVRELETLFNELKALAADTKVLAKTDPESALDKIDEFFGNMEEYWNQVSFVDMITNIQKGLSSAKSQIAAAERRLKSLERTKKIDALTIAELKDMLAEIKTKLPELQTLIKQKPIDYDAVQALGEELWDNVQMFENTMALYGQSNYLPSMQSGQGVKFEAPQGFISSPNYSGPMPETGNQPNY